MADINIKILKDENGEKFFPCTSIKGVIGEEYVHSVFPASEIEAGHFVITHEYLKEEELLNKIIGISFPNDITSSAQSYLKLNEGEEYPLMNEGGLTPLILTDLKNVVCFIMKKEDSWQLVKTGAAGSAGGGGGHVIVDEEYNIMPQRSLLRFAGLSISDDEVRDATVIGTPKLISNLTTETEGLGPLDAYQGKVLNDKIPEVVDDITSTSGIKALSANQGYLLNGKFNSYLPLSGGTLTGRLTTAELHVKGDWFWEGTKNILCVPSDNNQEWSFDIGSDGAGGTSAHTGSYAQFWSMKNQNTIISFHNDDDLVNIPNGKLHIHPQNSWHEGNNYDLRLGNAGGNHLDLGYDGMQAKNSSNGPAKLFFQYNGGQTQFGRSGADSGIYVYGGITTTGVNDFISSSNEINMIGSNYSRGGELYFNYRGASSAVTGYNFCNGAGSTSGVSLKANHMYADGGYLYSVCNGHTFSVGSQNNGWCHYNTTAPSHWFNKPVAVSGTIVKGSSYNVNVPGVFVQSASSTPTATQTGDIWFIP